MRFSLIATALALAFSVNAAAVDKRDVPTCVNALTAVASQLTVVANGVNDYTASKGYIGALAIQSQATNLEGKITTASASNACCIGSVVSVADGQTVIAKVDPLTTQTEAALSAIVTKKPVFDSVPLVTGLVKSEVNALKGKTDTLSGCLLASTPSELSGQAQGYVNRINAAFAAAIAAYA